MQCIALRTNERNGNDDDDDDDDGTDTNTTTEKEGMDCTVDGGIHGLSKRNAMQLCN